MRNQMKLSHAFAGGKHKGKTLSDVLESDVAYVKYLHRKGLIAFDPVAWDSFLEKAGGINPHKTGSSKSLYSRYGRR